MQTDSDKPDYFQQLIQDNAFEVFQTLISNDLDGLISEAYGRIAVLYASHTTESIWNCLAENKTVLIVDERDVYHVEDIGFINQVLV
jgi:hypothetical protein